MKKLLLLMVLLMFTALANGQQLNDPIGTWYGYDRYERTISGRTTRIVAPEQAAEGNPWVMRALWPDNTPELDTGLLDRGYHIVYMDLGDHETGSPQAMQWWDDLYSEMTNIYGFSSKAILGGTSRGGLQIHNWALQNIDKVQSIFGVVPVCDFRSWPGETHGPDAWNLVKEQYGFESDEEAYAYQGNVVDAYAPLVGSGIPIFHVAGTADTGVPMDENSQLLYDRLTAAGGEMWLEGVEGGVHADTWTKYLANVNNDLTAPLDYLTAVQTPEPTSLFLLGIASVSIVLRRKV